ncbi:hypothetical protein HN682_00615 [Candidatus Peregrinibacteria bacterium]|jgi:hypothetical protein|nr:hypothetical protein [Candidatus Peregrinibacteria bacterium]
MATEAYEVVGSLREMLQSQERREQSRVQTALAGMQFAQQKKMQDIQLAGQQLQFLQTVNTQMMTSEATQFLTSTGLGAIYSEEEDGVEKAIKTLTEKPKKGGFGFSESDANRIATAVWMSYKGSPSAILSIADELNTGFKKEKPSAREIALIKPFVSIGYITPEEFSSGKQESGELNSMSKTVQNTRDIAAEMYEYGRGEYEIQRDIGAFEPSEGLPKGPESEKDLSKALDEFEKLSATESKQDSRGIAPMVGDRESIEELTAGYDILDPKVAAAARSKLAELDVGLNTLQSQYDELEEERTRVIGNYDKNFSDYKQTVKAYDISVNAGMDRADLDVLAADAREYKSAMQSSRREQEAVNQYNRNPRRVFDLSRQGKDWRHSVSRAYIEPDEQDFADIGGVPTDLGTINLTNTNTYKMTELATQIFNVKKQQESFSLQ